MNGIIYKVTNTVNGKVYIGQTKKTLKARKKQHIKESEKDNPKKLYFHNALHKYGIAAFNWEQIDQAENASQLNDKEQDWITYYGSYGKYGYNLTPGGNAKISNEKAICAFSLDGQLLSEHPSIWEASVHYGIPTSSIGFVAIGKRITTHEKVFLFKDSFTNLAEMFREVRNRNRRHTPERSEKREIIGINRDGQFLIFPSIYQASKETFVCRKSIFAICSDSKKVSKKWVFYFKEESPSPGTYDFEVFLSQAVKRMHSRYRAVLVYDLDGKLVNRYKSPAEAERAFGCPRGAVSLCCSGKRKTAYRHIFLYEDEWNEEKDIHIEIKRRSKVA